MSFPNVICSATDGFQTGTASAAGFMVDGWVADNRRLHRCKTGAEPAIVWPTTSGYG
jgi:hypothetical protein